MAKELTRKEKQITQLYIETLEDVSKNADNWISFLKRASYNYKYKFDEQILIYRRLIKLNIRELQVEKTADIRICFQKVKAVDLSIC